MTQQTHYYGDRVRSLLITGAVTMVITLPFFTDLVPQPLFFTILAVLLLVLLGGLISPRHKYLVALSLFVSAGAFVAFEYYAMNTARRLGMQNAFFLVNQLLALIFLFAMYFGTKSTRWLAEREE